MKRQPVNYVTGNEYIALPEIRCTDASVNSFTFLHMGLKGMILVSGETPVLEPFTRTESGDVLTPVSIDWEKVGYWIPRFTASLGEGRVTGTILTPVNERGFAIRLELSPKMRAGDKCDPASRIVSIGLRGRVKNAFHRVNETKPIGRGLCAAPSAWNGAFVIDLVSDLPVFSFAPLPEPGTDVKFRNLPEGGAEYELTVPVDKTGKAAATFWWGLGFEEVAAITSAKELYRKGWKRVFTDTLSWLTDRARTVGDPDLDWTLNSNLFFNFFYATGITLDTEEFVMVTSRSPRYYVSASYWDRDSLLWSLPSILAVDRDRAFQMLLYAYGRQGRNVGVHSRYIDGTVLEPGFELDELVAPILALDAWARMENVPEVILREPFCSGIERILTTLETKHCPTLGMYETFLQPTDDPATLPYLTYDNVLVWKAFSRLATLYRSAMRAERSVELEKKADELDRMADELRKSILKHCVGEFNGKRIFLWAIDTDGRTEVYDEPPGSLELLDWHGFVPADDPVYRATVDRIRDLEYRYSFAGRFVDEIGCAHAPQPWILSLANSLLCARTEKGRRILTAIPMDDGVACESVDPDTGEVATGAAFATCAGFLAFAMLEAFGGVK
jgi:hypothetical protein